MSKQTEKKEYDKMVDDFYQYSTTYHQTNCEINLTDMLDRFFRLSVHEQRMALIGIAVRIHWNDEN